MKTTPNVIGWLVLILATLCLPAQGQGTRIGDDRPVFLPVKQGGITVLSPLPNPIINFCDYPSVGVPCTNKVVTYTDATLNTPCSTNSQVVQSGTTSCVSTGDILGNWGVWVPPGNYTYTITTSTGRIYGPFFASGGGGGGGGGNSGGTGTQVQVKAGTGFGGVAGSSWTGSLLTLPTTTVCNLNTWRSASTTCFASVQAAINDLPAGGGKVVIPPGTYAAPTSIPNQNTTLECSAWMGCTLTSAVNLTYGGAGSNLFEHLNLKGLVFDFGNTSSGLTLTNVQRGEFSIRVQNTTGDALTLLSSSGPYIVWPADSVAFNKFDYLEFRNVGEGLVLNGDANIASCGSGQSGTAGAVFLNDFRFINAFVSASGTNAIKFTSGTDNNTFGHTYINLANAAANGVFLGSRCPSSYGDVINQHFNYLGIDAATSPTGFGILAHQSQATILNYFTGSNLNSTSALSNNGFGVLKIGWTNAVPLSMSAPADQMQSWFMAPPQLATVGANQNSPIHKICANEWSGSVSVPACYIFQVITNSSGVPTFDTLTVTPTSTATNNNSFSVPQLTLQSVGTTNNVTFTTLGTGNGQKVNVPVAGGTMALLEANQTFSGTNIFSGSFTAGLCTISSGLFSCSSGSDDGVEVPNNTTQTVSSGHAARLIANGDVFKVSENGGAFFEVAKINSNITGTAAGITGKTLGGSGSFIPTSVQLTGAAGATLCQDGTGGIKITGCSGGGGGLTNSAGDISVPNVNSIVVDAGAGDLKVDFSILTDNAGGLTAKTFATSGTTAGLIGLQGAGSNPTLPTNKAGFLGPSAAITSYWLQWSQTAPSGGSQVFLVGTPSGAVTPFSFGKVDINYVNASTGTGSFVFASSPTLVTPVLGVATATSINKMFVTAPATSSTLTIADGKTFTINNTLTFTGTDGSSIAFGAGGTVMYTTTSVADAQMATKYKTSVCEGQIGDGLNAITAGTYVIVDCFNGFGATYTITAIKARSDNAGTSTVNAANDAATGLLTGAVTANTTWTSGTQSGTTTIVSADSITLTIVADGASKRIGYAVTTTR